MDTARAFSSRLAELLRNERSAMAEFLVALAEFDRDRGWVTLGYKSLFHYLNRELRLSNGPAFYRMTAAHLIQQHPEIVEPLRDGRLCLSTVAEVSKVVTRENLATVLPRFFGASKQQAKEIAAELSPQDVATRTVVTTVAVPKVLAQPARNAPPAAAPHPAEGRATSDLLLPEELHPALPPRPSDVAPMVVEPKTAELSRMHITVPRRLLEKLAAARDALSFSRPNASEDEVIEAGLDLILDRAAKRRGIVKNPRKTVSPATTATPTPTASPATTATTTPTASPGPSPTAPTRDIPAAESRAVWLRDQGMCHWPLASGGICGSTVRVSIHHKDAWAKHHGPPTLDRLMLACAFHQDLAARQDFGDAWMDQFTRGPEALHVRAGSGRAP